MAYTGFDVGAQDEIFVTLSHDTICDLFNDLVDGCCPICKTEINEGMIVCCECAEEIVVAHLNMGESCESPTIRDMSRRKRCQD